MIALRIAIFLVFFPMYSCFVAKNKEKRVLSLASFCYQSFSRQTEKTQCELIVNCKEKFYISPFYLLLLENIPYLKVDSIISMNKYMPVSLYPEIAFTVVNNCELYRHDVDSILSLLRFFPEKMDLKTKKILNYFILQGIHYWNHCKSNPLAKKNEYLFCALKGTQVSIHIFNFFFNIDPCHHCFLEYPDMPHKVTLKEGRRILKKLTLARLNISSNDYVFKRAKTLKKFWNSKNWTNAPTLSNGDISSKQSEIMRCIIPYRYHEKIATSKEIRCNKKFYSKVVTLLKSKNKQ